MAGRWRSSFGRQHTEIPRQCQCFAAKSGGTPMLTGSPSPWWAVDRHADRRPFLRARAAISGALRAWFAAAGFTEVETAILQVSPGNETHLHAASAQVTLPSGQRLTRYFRTSPEFACKKLLAAGEERIVE